MASTRFLDRSARVLWTRVVAKQQAERRGLMRLKAMTGGLILATAAFFALKGAAIAAGGGLPAGGGGGPGVFRGPPPGAPVFAGRG